MSQTITAPAVASAPATKRPLLHAFPEHSNVALCGRTRRQIVEDGTGATDRCPTCLREATRKQFVGR